MENESKCPNMESHESTALSEWVVSNCMGGLTASSSIHRVTYNIIYHHIMYIQ